MTETVTIIIFLVIGGLFWVVKTVAEHKARQNAREQYNRQEFDQDFDLDPEEYEEAPAAPVKPAPVPKAAPVPAAAPAARHSPLVRENSYAAYLKRNAANAILMQEILGPPKGLK